jgi:hypothetical protein
MSGSSIRRSSLIVIREIFREAFDRAGLPYFNPHSFRNTLAQKWASGADRGGLPPCRVPPHLTMPHSSQPTRFGCDASFIAANPLRLLVAMPAAATPQSLHVRP